MVRALRYRGTDKSLARPGRKQVLLVIIMVDDNKIVTIAAVIIMIFIYPFYSHNWRNIIYIYGGLG